MYVNVDIGKGEREINFENVSYVSNLISVSKVVDYGCNGLFRKNDAIVVNDENILQLRANRIGNLYYVNKCQDKVNNVETKRYKSEIDKWHVRLGHVNESDRKLMAKNKLVFGLKLKGNKKLPECEVCAREQLSCKPFPKTSVERTEELLEIVHTEVYIQRV